MAFWAGAAALALSGFFLLWLFLLQLWLLLQRKQRESALQRWRPLLMSGLYGQPDVLPPLSRLDLPHVLALWNHLHESLGIEARNSLDQLAGQVRIPAAVNRMLQKNSLNSRCLAARTAGNLQLASTWDQLLIILTDDSPALSLSSARALVQIDADRAIPLLIPLLSERTNWRYEAVLEVLQIAGSKRVAGPLLHAIGAISGHQSWLLLRFLLEIAPAEAVPLINRILSRPEEDERLLNACLDGLTTPEALEAVRALARHANWHVRVHVAKALGRVGMHEDGALLTDMLGDGQWWVRYRAAQALSLLRGMSIDELRHIKDIQTDRDARDMLHHVMAERELKEACMAAVHE
ncbi:MAG: HEAT repeat domain-containing protein [Sulfuricella denitrificans]|nr:HEAT repeat domain-containing protein [Sulfuricella denitrificans]